MFDFFQLTLISVLFLVSASMRSLNAPHDSDWIRALSAKGKAMTVLSVAALLGCVFSAVLLREPVPRGHDEFSYLLMADTFTKGRIANSSPPVPEFFDTFHVIVRPVYASKYFAAQGIFLAVGQKLTGHPAVGLWLSSALACAAIYWMLLAWSSPNWALFSSLIWMIQYGIFSYWSQSYWGGMVPALGGALAFGAARRLWDRFSWPNSIWLGLGVIVLVNSRPVEGFLALLLICIVSLRYSLRDRLWKRAEFLTRCVLPAGVVLASGAFLTCTYNRAVTGSAWKPPHLLHEEQYEQAPEFAFLPMHARITYSSPWLEYLYGVREVSPYRALHDGKRIPRVIARKLVTWWAFYCGVLLTPPLVVPGLLRKGVIRVIQIGLMVALGGTWALAGQDSTALKVAFDVLAVVQFAVLWIVFDDFWERLAIATIGLLLIEYLSTKWSFPHYFAPAVCLVLFLQVQGLRRMWHWAKNVPVAIRASTRKERRKLEREGTQQGRPTYPLRGFVYFLPMACLLSLAIRVEARRVGWNDDPHGPDRQALLMNDWSLRREELRKWLEQQPGQQLVFVTYTARHNVNNEWVYNDADLPNSHVAWARDLDPEHNRLLLNAMPGRTVWWLEADKPNCQLVPYREHQAPPLPFGLQQAQENEADSSAN